MILQGDALEMLKTMESESVDCCVTSPPYYALRDYGVDGQIGLEDTPEEYINRLADVFDEVRRVLKDEGTLWLNIADSYWGSGSRGYDFTDKFTEASAVQANSLGTVNLSNLPELKGHCGEYKNKDMIGIPWMLAFELRKRGWYLRQDIIWHKPNPMPESVTDRCTKSHEYIFLMSKSQRYYFDNEAIQERASYDGRKAVTFSALTSKYDGTAEEANYKRSGKNRWQWKEEKDEVYAVRNKRDVWTITTKALKEAHFATYPTELVEPCVLAGTRRGGVILDPFFGSGTTGVVAEAHGRKYIGIELNPEYVEIAERRLSNVQLSMF